MDLRRPLLVGAGALLCLVAGLPGALGAERAAVPAQVQSAAVASDVGAVPPADVMLPDSVTVPTTRSYEGEPRPFVLHVPDGLPAPAPLVVALHAHSQKPDAIRAYSRLEALADEQGFVVAFPEGASGSWNAGGCCFPGSVVGVDDVAFLDEVVAISRTKALIDPARIYVTGGSNGAMMALRYACERSETVAAVAVVAGPLLAPCAPILPVPVLVLHGAGDSIVPLNGGRNEKLDVTFPPVDSSLEPFRRAGGEVRLQVVPRAGHHWMTRDEHGVDATRTIWSWLRDHPRVR
ncbi:MAG: PHB depolymerase family esterase [Mycobacteriales bacterium]